MSGKARASLLSLTVIVVLIFSALGPTIVYADGETPPETTTTEATSLPEETTAETTSTPEPVVTEATSAPDQTTTDATEVATEVPAKVTSEPDAATPEAVAEQPAEEAAPATEEAAPDKTVLDEVPENTTVTVLDANGEAQPLVTQEVADAIAASDPIWCPSTATSPTPEANGCTRSFPSFTELLTFLAAPENQATYAGAGTIYVEQGAYQGNDPNNVVDFNAYSLGNIRSAPLTVTGGWNISTQTVDNTTTSDFTDTQIIIGASGNPWGGSLTINNISMNFTNASSPPPDPAQNGLTLYSAGSIELSNVSVMNAPSAGAEIDAAGDVTISNSNFSRNRTAGANIRSGANVSIASSSFSNPPNGRRQVAGLNVTSTGGTSLFEVLADENREVGANINSTGPVTIANSSFSRTKEMRGSGANTVFSGYGLKVITPSTITIDNVDGNENFLYGASLDAGGDITIQNSRFNDNTTASPGFIDDTGLFINGGAFVTLSNVEASRNRLYGAQITAVNDVSIAGSTFNDNRGTITTGGVTTDNGHGLQITTLASILISSTTATNNMLFGGELTATNGQVSIANSTFSNTSTGSSSNAVGQGLKITSGGLTSLLAVVMDNNQTVGANIQAGGLVMLQDVTATDNTSDGVALQGTCTALIGGTYSGNGQYGLNLGNSALNLLSSPSFANNGAGDIFPENPPTCSFLTSTPTATASAATGVAAVGASNVFASLQIAPQKSDSNSANVSLNSFMANTRTVSGGIHGLFMGKYAYVYGSSGMQVVAYAPSSTELAKD